MPSPLHSFLIEQARQRGGVLPFSLFMHHCLYHPDLGYYMREKPRLGRDGDFFTAPEMTSLFGEMLCLQWVQIWQGMGMPSTFTLVEAGAGSGKLAFDLLATASRFPRFFDALHYIILEISPDFQMRQREHLGTRPELLAKTVWIHDLGELEAGLVGGILSNELLDAFPVHWVEMTGEGLREVAVEPQGWQTRLIPLTNPLLETYFSRAGVLIEPGYRTEVGLDGQKWLGEAAGKLAFGAVLTIDYGYTGREYYHPLRNAGTLVGHFRHQRVDNPLLNPGEMDLTAHVDFSALHRVGKEMGMETMGFAPLSGFLMGMGILDRLERLLQRLSEVEGQALREVVMRLLLPGGFGERFRVLCQGKGLAGDVPLAGFSVLNWRDRL